jgi:hypothetical protein
VTTREQKSGLENIVFVMEEDGCELDHEYLPVLSPDTKLMCLGEGETWSRKRKEPASGKLLTIGTFTICLINFS